MKEFVSKLTWVDYLTLIAVLRGCYVGYRSGLFPEFLRIAGYLVTVVVTFKFQEPVSQYLTLKTFLNAATCSAISFIGLLALVFALTKLVTMLLLKLLKIGEGGFFYRLLGMVIGACRWVILLSLIFMLIDFSPLAPLKSDIHNRSVVGAKVAALAPTIFEFLANLSPQLAVSDTKTP